MIPYFPPTIYIAFSSAEDVTIGISSVSKDYLEQKLEALALASHENKASRLCFVGVRVEAFSSKLHRSWL